MSVIFKSHANVHNAIYKNVEIETTKQGNETFSIMKTPVGSVTTKHKSTGKMGFRVKSFVENRDDLKVMQYIAERTDYSICCDKFFEIDNRIGQAGIASADAPVSPLESMLYYFMTIEEFTFLLNDYEKEVEEFMWLIHHNNKKLCKMLAKSPKEVNIFFAYEDTSTTLYGPEWYKKYCQSYSRYALLYIA